MATSSQKGRGQMGKKGLLRALGALASLLLSLFLFPAPGDAAGRVGVLLGQAGGEVLLRLEAAWLQAARGRVVEFLARPSHGSRRAARRWARALLADPEVALLIVADHPAVARTALEVARPSGASILSCAPGEAEELETEHPYLLQIAPGPAAAAERILRYIARRGMERLALVAPLDPYGTKGGELLSALAPAHGVSVLLDARHPDKRRSLSELFRVARDRGAQVLVYWGRDGPGQAVLGTYKDLGLPLPLILGPAFSRPRWLEEARSAPEGALVPVATFWVSHLLPAGHPQRRAIEAFRARFERSLGRPPTLGEGCLSDALSLAAAALARGRGGGRRGGREAVRRALLGVEGFQGVMSRFRFSEWGRRGAGAEAFQMVRVRAGKVELAP